MRIKRNPDPFEEEKEEPEEEAGDDNREMAQFKNFIDAMVEKGK